MVGKIILTSRYTFGVVLLHAQRCGDDRDVGYSRSVHTERLQSAPPSPLLAWGGTVLLAGGHCDVHSDLAWRVCWRRIRGSMVMQMLSCVDSTDPAGGNGRREGGGLA